MVENCTNTILDERGYVSSCGVNTWKVSGGDLRSHTW